MTCWSSCGTYIHTQINGQAMAMTKLADLPKQIMKCNNLKFFVGQKLHYNSLTRSKIMDNIKALMLLQQIKLEELILNRKLKQKSPKNEHLYIKNKINFVYINYIKY